MVPLRFPRHYLRAQPGVGGAWSVADLFFGVSFAGDEVSRIPDSADLVRQSILASTLLRTGREQLSEIVGADAATITAEDWPVNS